MFPANNLNSFLFFICFESIGTKAVFNAPSAKNLRNMFGKAKAIMKASAMMPDPKKEAIRISLRKPKILLKSVQNPTVNIDFTRLIFFSEEVIALPFSHRIL